MGLSARARDKFSTYSLGMKQRLCVAAALLTDPRLIILDEPTNGLDPAGMADIRNLIKDLAAQGRTVLLSSHLLHEVQQVCNRVAIIQQGSIIVQGRVEDLLAGKTSIYVHVQQHEWEKSWYVLQAAGYTARLRAEGEYLIIAGIAAEGVEINRVLATNGIFAGEISPRSQTLEEYYLSLTTHYMPYPMQPVAPYPGGAYNGN
jgi:ABC-2 type transport system ATP-binding protein